MQMELKNSECVEWKYLNYMKNKEQKTHQSHCDKSHNILSQKQMCHSSLKQNYIQCITLFKLHLIISKI
jgi:hypothetical protein